MPLTVPAPAHAIDETRLMRRRVLRRARKRFQVRGSVSAGAGDDGGAAAAAAVEV